MTSLCSKNIQKRYEIDKNWQPRMMVRVWFEEKKFIFSLNMFSLLSEIAMESQNRILNSKIIIVIQIFLSRQTMTPSFLMLHNELVCGKNSNFALFASKAEITFFKKIYMYFRMEVIRSGSEREKEIQIMLILSLWGNRANAKHS